MVAVVLVSVVVAPMGHAPKYTNATEVQWTATARAGTMAPAFARAAGMSYREGRFWQPDVTVATVVVSGGRLLMVEETVRGRLVLNQPAGHLEPDESLVEAALRETREETGWDVRLTAFVGAYQWRSPDTGDGEGRHYLRFAFAAEPVAHDPTRPLDDGIARALWMTPGELREAAPRHRSPLVWRAVHDHLSGRRHPLDLLSHLPAPR